MKHHELLQHLVVTWLSMVEWLPPRVWNVLPLFGDHFRDPCDQRNNEDYMGLFIPEDTSRWTCRSNRLRGIASWWNLAVWNSLPLSLSHTYIYIIYIYIYMYIYMCVYIYTYKHTSMFLRSLLADTCEIGLNHHNWGHHHVTTHTNTHSHIHTYIYIYIYIQIYIYIYIHIIYPTPSSQRSTVFPFVSRKNVVFVGNRLQKTK